MEFLAIAGIIAAGAFITCAVVITIRWLKDKIRSILAKRNIKKVAAMDLEKLIEECPNQKTLNDLYDEGYDKVIASVDNSGKIQDVEAYKDEGCGDPEVDKFIGSEGMVVVTNLWI